MPLAPLVCWPAIRCVRWDLGGVTHTSLCASVGLWYSRWVQRWSRPGKCTRALQVPGITARGWGGPLQDGWLMWCFNDTALLLWLVPEPVWWHALGSSGICRSASGRPVGHPPLRLTHSISPENSSNSMPLKRLSPDFQVPGEWEVWWAGRLEGRAAGAKAELGSASPNAFLCRSSHKSWCCWAIAPSRTLAVFLWTSAEQTQHAVPQTHLSAPLQGALPSTIPPSPSTPRQPSLGCPVDVLSF